MTTNDATKETSDYPQTIPDSSNKQIQADGLVIITVGADQDRFADLAANHAKWHAVAHHLFAAAEKLWPEIEAGFSETLASGIEADALRFRGPCYVLVGLAFENLAKGIIVRMKQARSETITEKGVLQLGGNHDLVRCMRDAGFVLDEGEQALLVRLSRFVLWQGRYPVPKKANQLPDLTITGSTDMRHFRKLFAKVDAEYWRLGAQAESGGSV